MKKQLLLIVMMLLPMVAWGDAVKIDGIWYNLVSKIKTAEVTRNSPGEYSGAIVIPEKVTYKGEEYSVTSIASEAFMNCRSLISVTIPNSVTSIGSSVFYNCSGLTSVAIGNSVTSIRSNAFYNCSGLTSITIPNSVTSIGDWAFYKCTGLTSITIPNSVTSIGKEAFWGCDRLTSVHISDLEAWCKISFTTSDSNPLYCAHHLYLNGSEITNLDIPNSVTTIGHYAFYECFGLTSVTIPNSVTSIGKSSFSSCSGLTSITIPNSVTSIEPSTFSSCFRLTSVTIPNSVTRIGSNSFSNCSGLTSITIPNSVTSIGSNSFSNCSGLTSITIGNGTTSIYSSAFANCPELTDVTCMAEIVPSTENNAFANSYIKYATLYVPETAIDAYKTTVPWSGFKSVEKIVMPAHKLTYLVDGEEYKSYEIEEGATITPEAVPEKEGYTFSGWSEIPETMPAHDVTITGTFSINKYKLIYKVDGVEYKSFDIEYGATITPEVAPADKEGYTFSGWSEIPETMPAYDVTVTGTFSINKYKLVYKVDGEEYKTYEVEYGTAITPEEEPEKDGYTFSGWSEIPETMPAHDVTIIGTFSINSYKLTYILDNEVYKEVIYEYGATITPEPIPEGNYASFEWEGLPETMPAKDVVVHAKYTTGINEILMSTGSKRIYSPNGKQLDNLQKGANIIRMKDGSTRKVMMK